MHVNGLEIDQQEFLSCPQHLKNKPHDFQHMLRSTYLSHVTAKDCNTYFAFVTEYVETYKRLIYILTCSSILTVYLLKKWQLEI